MIASNSLRASQNAMAQQQSLGQQNSIGAITKYSGSQPMYPQYQAPSDPPYTYAPDRDGFINNRTGEFIPSTSTTKSGILTPNKPEETNMVKEVVQDLKSFIKDHKSTIYLIAVLLIVDHFVFNGSMKEKLKSMMQNLVGKVENKLNETKV